MSSTRTDRARPRVPPGQAHPPAVYAARAAAPLLDSGTVTVIEEGHTVFLAADLPSSFDGLPVDVVTRRRLPRWRLADADADADFEERDGLP